MTDRLKRLATSISLIIVIAFLIRLTFAWFDSLGRPIPEEYSWETGRIARSLAMGKGFGNPYPGVETGPTAIMSPLYPLLLGGIFKLFGVYSYASYFVAILLNELISALTCIPIFFLGKRIGGLSVAATSAWLWAVFPAGVIVPSTWLWDTTLTTLVLITIIWATLELSESIKTRDWIWYGLLWGFGLAMNPSILSTMPFLMLWLVWRLRKRAQQWLKLPAIALSVMFLCCIPWAARNYVDFHRVIPFRSNFGLELWLGNNPDDIAILPDHLSPFLNTRLHDEYVAKGEIAFMQAKKAESIRYIRSAPLTFLKYTWYRFLQMWLGIEEPMIGMLTNYSARVTFIVSFNLFIVLAGLSGLLIFCRKHPEISTPIAAVPLVYPAIYYVTHPSLRYRHPMDPILIVMAAFAICYVVSAVTRRKSVLLADAALAADVPEAS
jgi:dolichyl-phosphate-mannose-protein mannosyltransferase